MNHFTQIQFINHQIFVQAALFSPDAITASINFMPLTPSSTVGKSA
jgi:hypothetical protein